MGAWRTTNPSSESSDRGTGVGAVGDRWAGGGGGAGHLMGIIMGRMGCQKKMVGTCPLTCKKTPEGEGPAHPPTHPYKKGTA